MIGGSKNVKMLVLFKKNLFLMFTFCAVREDILLKKPLQYNI